MKKIVVALAFILISTVSFAEESWLCRDSSSTRTGDSTIVACGVGQGAILQLARDSALNAAISEFEKICSTSADCKAYEAVSSPKRTDCEKTQDGFRCFRAVEFNISKTPKKSIMIDLEALEREIGMKQEQLRQVQNQIRLREQATQLDKEIEKTELELAGLKEKIEDSKSPSPQYQIRVRDKIAGLTLEVSGAPIKAGSMTTLMFSGFIERQFFSFIGIQGRLGYRYGIGGQKYSVADTYEYTLSGVEAAIALPIYFNNYSLKPEVGFFLGGYEHKTPAIIGSGNGAMIDTSNLTSQSTSLNQAFLGVSVGYEWRRWFIYGSYRHYQNSNGIDGADSFGGGAGFQYKF